MARDFKSSLIGKNSPVIYIYIYIDTHININMVFTGVDLIKLFLV
jgi:hypothetical protein